jgi:hypothetical protein
MAQITVIMHVEKVINDHVLCSFQREHGSAWMHTSWDNIQKWVSDGYSVLIRPATEAEKKAFEAQRAKLSG